MFKTIKSKFIFITLILITVSVAVPSYFLMIQFRENFNQRSELMINSALDVVVRGIYDRMMTNDHEDIQEIINDISLNPSVDHVRIIDENAMILYASDTTEIGKNLNKINPNHLTHQLADSMRFTRLNDEGVYSAVQPIKNTESCQQCHIMEKHLGYIDIDTKLTQAESYFYTGSLHIVFLAILIIIILFLIFYTVFEKFINKPLNKFVYAMDEVEKGNLTVSLPADKKDEIGMLEKNFNKMVRKLDESQSQIEELHFEQLRHADKLVTLGELAAEMAHEINNPAAIIMSRADFMYMEAENNYQLENYKDDLEVIVNQTQRVSKITQNILKYSKKLPKNFEHINLVKIINESLKILEPRLIKYGIKLKRNFHSTKTVIFGDTTQLEQVITNLVNNGIDAIGKNGEMHIETRITKNDHVQLLISDNGEGIEDHILDNIFQPFFTTKKGNKGTGLGLYIVNNICKNHNAKIECESKPGEGTRFIITFKGVNEKI